VPSSALLSSSAAAAAAADVANGDGVRLVIVIVGAISSAWFPSSVTLDGKLAATH